MPEFKNFKRDREDDSAVCAELWRLYDHADVIVAHNGDRFDHKKASARFIYHGLNPPSPYKSVDTLKIARSRFAFLSNKLDDLGAYLGLGRKLPHTGFHLWKACMQGEGKAWEKMRRYNAQDVVLLERVYNRLKPWTSNHPNLAALSERPCCPVCQSKRMQRRGLYIALTRAATRTQRYQCQDCGHWSARAESKDRRAGSLQS